MQDKGAGFKSDTNKVTLIDKEENMISYELKSKKEVAEDIFNEITKQLNV